MLSRVSMMMTNLETLKISFALDIKLFDESVSRDIGTEGSRIVTGASDSHGIWAMGHAPFCPRNASTSSSVRAPG
jgi:hypothetical protein